MTDRPVSEETGLPTLNLFGEYDLQIIHDPMAKPSQRMTRATKFSCISHPALDGDIWIETLTYKQYRRCGTFFFTDAIGSERLMRLHKPSQHHDNGDTWIEKYISKLDRVHYVSNKDPKVVWLEAKTPVDKVTCFVSLKTGLMYFDEPPSGASIVLYFKPFGLAEF